MARENLKKAKELLAYWKNIKSKKIENELNVPKEVVDEFIEHFEEKVSLLKSNINIG